ncbi:hypothetical protein MCOR11_011402 [Pyricularia oryzae]|nr:hypothetical protein MCOR11_011402 [Pyricularia oryzae]
MPLPTGLHWPEMRFENFFFLLPSRAATGARKGEAGLYPDEGLEVTFGMEESCFARHEKDAELLQFCENGSRRLRAPELQLRSRVRRGDGDS